MADINILTVLVATVVAFVLSSIYYVVLADQLATVSTGATAGEHTAPWTIAAELLRSLVVVAVVAGLASSIATSRRS